VTNSAGTAVTKLRASDGAVQPGSPFTAGTNPFGIAFDGANVWVANYGSNTVQKM
jgi:DNA-binding beta-propeller fold protein YncE